MMRSSRLALFAILFAARAGAVTITCYAEEYPPFNFIKDGKPAGMSTELLEATCQEAHVDCQIKIVPWPRAFREAVKNPDTLVFSTARIPVRENSFVWLGPISRNLKILLYVRRDSPLHSGTIEELEGSRIGVVNGDSAVDQLTRAGLEGVSWEPAPNVESNVLKLLGGHIDVLPAVNLVMTWTMQRLGQDAQQVRPLTTITDSADLYFALNPTGDMAAIEAMKAAWAKISSGRLPDEIAAKYVKGL